MNTKEMIAVMQAFEAGKVVRYGSAGKRTETVTKDHVWYADWTYHITEQPKTVTVEYWESESGNIELSRKGSPSSVEYHKDDFNRLIASIEVRE